jgi:hypothetical protein
MATFRHQQVICSCSFLTNPMPKQVYIRTAIDDVIDVARLSSNKKKKTEQALTGCIYEDSMDVRSFSLNNCMYVIESKITKSSGFPIGLVQVWFGKSGDTYIGVSTGSMNRFETYHNFTVSIAGVQIEDTLGKVDAKVYKCLDPIHDMKIHATRDGQAFKNWKFVFNSDLPNDLLKKAENCGLKLHNNNSKSDCIIL